MKQVFKTFRYWSGNCPSSSFKIPLCIYICNKVEYPDAAFNVKNMLKPSFAIWQRVPNSIPNRWFIYVSAQNAFNYCKDTVTN